VSKGSLTTNKTMEMESLKELGMMDERDPVPYCLGYGVMDAI
jgi:hypothetical protein